MLQKRCLSWWIYEWLGKIHWNTKYGRYYWSRLLVCKNSLQKFQNKEFRKRAWFTCSKRCIIVSAVFENFRNVSWNIWGWPCKFFSICWVFFHKHSRITGLPGKAEGISLSPHYHFHPLYRYLDISWAIPAESSPLHMASSRTRTGNRWFPSAGG